MDLAETLQVSCFSDHGLTWHFKTWWMSTAFRILQLTNCTETTWSDCLTTSYGSTAQQGPRQMQGLEQWPIWSSQTFTYLGSKVTERYEAPGMCTLSEMVRCSSLSLSSLLLVYAVTCGDSQFTVWKLTSFKNVQTVCTMDARPFGCQCCMTFWTTCTQPWKSRELVSQCPTVQWNLLKLQTSYFIGFTPDWRNYQSTEFIKTRSQQLAIIKFIIILVWRSPFQIAR